MKVILLHNIKGFGQIGDVKNVSDGYARNFLLPRKMVKAATESSLKEVDNLKKKLSAMQEVEKETAVKIAEQL
ncbi:MAG: 50S ribosomal protein L9, partial [bacterium]|nr:50S ribosomal protein L9 [bacterium]